MRIETGVYGIEIIFLGTAAAEGWPSVFCLCEACREAARLGGKNIRTRSQAVVDGRLLLDFPPDTYMHNLYGELDLNEISDILITHSHGDHFYPPDLLMRSEGYAEYDRDKIIHLYGNKAVMEIMAGHRAEKEHNFKDLDAHLHLHEVSAGQVFITNGYTITALKADHGTSRGEETLIYLIEKDRKALLYGHDTGYFPEGTWKYLRNKKLSFASLDCTHIINGAERHHMGLAGCGKVRQRLLDEGIADANTVFFVNHFSHNGGGHLLHDELEKEAAKYGFQVSYDGCRVEF